MIETVIFDLDGLLADTEKLHRRAYQEALREVGITLTDRQYNDHWIRDGKGIADFIRQHDLPITPSDVRPQKAERYTELVASSVQPMPGAEAVLEALHEVKTLAVATASYARDAHHVLATLGIEHYFSVVATKENAARTKPAPDVFLWVADSLRVAPQACVVVEDAEKGIVAAQAAGMWSIAVPNQHTRHNDFSRASLVLASLHELTPELIASRLGGQAREREPQSTMPVR